MMSRAQHFLEEALRAASALAGEGWHARLGAGARGQGEIFLAAAYGHVRARSPDADAFYSLEAEPHPMSAGATGSDKGPFACAQQYRRSPLRA